MQRSRSRMILAAIASLGLVAPVAALRADDYVSPGQARLKADVYYLADDAREGRRPGTQGLDASADYIAATFKELGLKTAPGADGYFQYFDLPGRKDVLGDPILSVNVKKDGGIVTGEYKKDFAPLALGGPADLKGVPIVFAGYGITADDSALKLKYDDYEGIDAKDKAVLIIRREPQQNKEDSPFAGKENTPYAQFRHKVDNALKHGAKMVLLVNDGVTVKEGKDDLLDFLTAGGNGTAKVGFCMVSRDFASKALAAAGGPSLEEVEKGIDSDLKPRSKELEGVTLDSDVKIGMKGLKVKNVIGVLEGSGPLADETVIVGAHYDHVGKGEDGNSLAFGVREIHNGADDNASGTATVMELARRLAKRPDPLGRRVVFMTFSAEELGLIGSDYYVNHPLYPLDKTVAMINFDMVGRLNKDRELTIFGLGSSPGFESLVMSLTTDHGMKPNNIFGTQGEFNQSDHASFYKKGLPVIFFFTGTHPDYHRPADDADKINYEGMGRIADLGELLMLDFARRPERPKFTKMGRAAPKAVVTTEKPAPTAAPASDTASPKMSAAYFGSRPSYGDTGGKGVKLDGVSEGGPAEKAGLKEGDVVIKFAGKDVKDLDTYMAAMGEKKPGDTVEVVVKRGDKEMKFDVKLTARPGASPKN